MKLSEKKLSATHRVLVYGGPKTGKTELVGKLSEFYKLIWFDIEQGWITLTKLPEAWQQRIELVSVPDSRIMPMGIETWLKIIKGTECNVCEAHGKVSCAICAKQGAPITRVCLNETGPDTIVVFDSLTQLTNSAISNITKAQTDDYKLDYGDWGQLSVLVDKFLSQVQAARYNIVCITHESEVEMEDGKNRLVPVCGSSKSSRNTAKYFDDVVYCEVKNKKHVAGSSTSYSNSAITGSRTNAELEKAGDKGATLLDIFGKPTHTERVIALDVTLVSDSNSSGGSDSRAESKLESEQKVVEIAKVVIEATADSMVPTETRTPSQIALERLKGMKR
jgi:hypothetical protein